jgi:hypothetical protein
MYGDRNFLEENKFMRLPDGRIAFFTEKKTWRDVLKNELPLDEYLDRQTFTPKISFEFKTPKRRQRKNKEDLNDEDRCDMCCNPLDTMTFVTLRGRKQVFCSICTQNNHEGNIIDKFKVIQNHILDVNAILYLLNEDVLPIECFGIHIKYLTDTWKSYIGNEVIKQIFDMMKKWRTICSGDINVLKLVKKLLMLKRLLMDEMVFLKNIIEENQPW